jgi:antitoxin (DNA-binding transcriptional repressor) of toxin-antitoxin stability system
VIVERRDRQSTLVYHQAMGTLHITEAELARDPQAVLAKVEEGIEVIIERNHRPVATIRSPQRSGRPISACIASAKASGSKLILDSDFGKDVEAGISERSKPWNPPSWD